VEVDVLDEVDEVEVVEVEVVVVSVVAVVSEVLLAPVVSGEVVTGVGAVVPVVVVLDVEVEVVVVVGDWKITKSAFDPPFARAVCLFTEVGHVPDPVPSE